ncbi:MAG: hypothetical protein HOQ45_22375, partial [Nocardioidaceae bacterium]|nr:hypothetical protein [Nocardioidaceae bacterium]
RAEPTVAVPVLDLAFEEQPLEQEAPPRERPPWLVPAVLAGLVLVLLLSAYGIGRLFSDSVSDATPGTGQPSSLVLGGDAGDGGDGGNGSGQGKAPKGKKYTGPTDQAAIGGASATCESAPGVDSAGNKVGYQPGNVYDGDLSTAWRCDGDGAGQKLTIELADPTKIGEVGLVPGYAKTDPRSGVDRYRENNRITKVRWSFSNGTAVEQTFDPSPKQRSMQTLRIPVVQADRVVMEILSSAPGPRHTIAVSEVRVGRVAG